MDNLEHIMRAGWLSEVSDAELDQEIRRLEALLTPYEFADVHAQVYRDHHPATV